MSNEFKRRYSKDTQPSKQKAVVIAHVKHMDLLKKLVIIAVGSVVSAYGITLALYAGFGGATLAVLWQGLAATFPISIGMASFIVALVMILFTLVYDRKQIHIGTILYQIIYSACVDLFASCHIYSSHMLLNFLIMLCGVILFAAGTGLYASAALGRGSYEAVTFALAEKHLWQVKTVRMALDAIMVVAGVMLGGSFGLCTIITVIISGPIIQCVNNKSKQLFHL